MSTRRARIKAVAALPQRRKNVDNLDSKNRINLEKELAINVNKSPKSIDKIPGGSPATADHPSPRALNSLKCTPDLEKSTNALSPAPVVAEKASNYPLHDKTDTTKPAAWKSDVFVSPRARASPLPRQSPIVRTPVIEVEIGVEKNIVPHKTLLESQDSLKARSHTVTNNRKQPKNVLDDFINPSTPETENVMDGIVPLKQLNNAPKPIEILKSEIISENAEVLFDPIVPLPSPTKARQKLRPVPRLGPMRRNSIPGSASESEDESRRTLQGGSSTPVPSRQRHDSQTSHSTMQSLPNRDVSRVRNDSVCSSVSQLAPQTPAALGSPLKEKQNVTRSRRVDVSRRMAAMRRRKESIQRDQLTMFDLIFYNPTTNPIVPDQDEINAKAAAKKDEEERKLQRKKEEATEDTNVSNTETAAPVPQIKLGPNGEIILDEQSLVIKQSDQRQISDTVVREGAWMSDTSRVYRRTPRTADWSDAETVRFYRALAAMGTDFSLMTTLFPGRNRRDLKLKFKKEERTNLAQVDKALRSATEWDANRLEMEFTDERKEDKEREERLKEQMKEAKKAERERTRELSKLRVKQSKASKALGDSVLPANERPSKSNQINTADEFIERVMANKLKKQQQMAEKALNPQKSEFATLTMLGKPGTPLPKVGIPRLDNNMATLQKKNPLPSPSINPLPQKSPVVLNPMPNIPADIAPGSLVVLTVDDPKAPSQKVIHTYIKQADGSITSITLDPSVMSSLVSYVKKDTPKAGSSSSTMSPCSVVSDRTNTPPVGASPNKRPRHSSYNITDL